jgi:hypothetical protein
VNLRWRISWTTALYFCISILVYSEQAKCGAGDAIPEIKKFRCSETPYGYHMTAWVQQAFARDLEEAVNAGMPASIIYHVRFKLYRWYWDTRVLREAKYTYTVSCDTLRKTYTIIKKKEGIPQPLSITTTDNPVTMKTMMCSFEGDIDFNLKSIKDGKQYYLALDASIGVDAGSDHWDSVLYSVSDRYDTVVNRLWLPVKQKAD